MEVLESFLVLGVVFGFSFGIVAICLYAGHRQRLLRHQERLAAIEKGLLPADLEKVSHGGDACCAGRRRFRGVTTLFVGIGLAIALYVTAGPKTAVWGAFVGIIALGQLLQSYLTHRSTRPAQDA